MKYIGMPYGMWLLYRKSFRERLVSVLGCSPREAKEITERAKPRYREIIEKLPAFEKGDRFQMNIVNCAMLCAFVLSMERRPTVEELTDYYAKAMMTAPTRWFCRMSGKRRFTAADLQGMKDTAALRAADRNPYSWNMDYRPYPDGSGYNDHRIAKSIEDSIDFAAKHQVWQRMIQGIIRPMFIAMNIRQNSCAVLLHRKAARRKAFWLFAILYSL